MPSEKVQASERLVEIVEQAQETMQRLQTEVQAILYGAAAALNVPDGWQWDGSGWIAPPAKNQAE